MVRIYLAHDAVLARDVALKVLRKQYADDEQFIERFRREARRRPRSPTRTSSRFTIGDAPRTALTI